MIQPLGFFFVLFRIEGNKDSIGPGTPAGPGGNWLLLICLGNTWRTERTQVYSSLSHLFLGLGHLCLVPAIPFPTGLGCCGGGGGGPPASLCCF